MRRLGRVAALIAAFGLLGCSSLNPFSSSGPKIPPLKPITDSVKLGEDWKLRVGSAGTSVFSPLVVGSAVYAAAADGMTPPLGLVFGLEVLFLAALIQAQAQAVALFLLTGPLALRQPLDGRPGRRGAVVAAAGCQ